MNLFYSTQKRERAFAKFRLTWRSSPGWGRWPRVKEYLKVGKYLFLKGVTRKTAVDDYFGTTFRFDLSTFMSICRSYSKRPSSATLSTVLWFLKRDGREKERERERALKTTGKLVTKRISCLA